MKRTIITAKDWFDNGQRLAYDYQNKKVLKSSTNDNKSAILDVFQRMVNSQSGNSYAISMLAGFPDGSFGWANTEHHLKDNNSQRLYVEYVGQGDSDKPEVYPYGIQERADLVEALWKYHGIKKTFLVTFDYSSLVALELLRRQKERAEKVEVLRVLFINGGLFADSHSHPYLTTPLLKTSFGKMGTKIAQRSHFAFNMMMKDLWSKEYGITKGELKEVFNAITRRNGAFFMSNAAGFVDEHKRNAERLDLFSIYQEMHRDVSFHIVGSEKDQFEPLQIINARERLGKFGVDIRMLPGGHMSTSEQPDRLAEIIQELDVKV